jgi:hypothetical protein
MNGNSSSKKAVMRSTAFTILGGIGVAALSFIATIYALDWFSGSPTSSPFDVSTNSTPAQISTSEPKPVVTQLTALGDLPKLAISGLSWREIDTLNVQVMAETPVVPDQAILRLIAIPSDDRHYLGAQATGLVKNRVYRITAWVKPEAGANFEIEAGDHANTEPSYGTGIFDLANHNMAGTAKPGSAPGPGDWQKVWIDLPTSTGLLAFNFYVLKGGGMKFTGDGRLGVTLGGFTVDPQD